MDKHKVLVVYDIAKTYDDGVTLGWAYWRRAAALKRHAPRDIEIDLCAIGDLHRQLGSKKYDLVFNMEYAAPSGDTIRRHGAIAMVSYNSDERRRHEFWRKAHRDTDWLVINNKSMWEWTGRSSKACCISNGVEIDTYYPKVPIEHRPERVLWCGSTARKKGKGYQEVMQMLEKMLPRDGFEYDFRPINDINREIVFPEDKQVEWYNSGTYVLCAAKSEGTPNTSLEGMASGCVLVTTRVGNAREFGRDRDNCVICDRTPESFMEGLLYAREHKRELSKRGRETMESWAYGPPGHRAQYFYQLFRRAIRDGVNSLKPFSYDEMHWSDI